MNSPVLISVRDYDLLEGFIVRLDADGEGCFNDAEEFLRAIEMIVPFLALVRLEETPNAQTDHSKEIDDDNLEAESYYPYDY